MEHTHIAKDGTVYTHTHEEAHEHGHSHSITKAQRQF